MEAVARLPWWMGLLMALASYGVLRVVGSELRGTPSVAIVSIAQLAVPLMCVFSALTSFLLDMKRRGLHSLARKHGRRALVDMTWREFEMLTHELFRLRGYDVFASRPGPDGGVDLELRKAERRTLVQCKRWLERDVDVRVARELAGVVATEHADGGVLVSSGSFTPEAREFAKRARLELIDGEALVKLAGFASQRFDSLPRATGSKSPACPDCGADMRLRTARRGRSVGSQFYGCSKYPGCRGTRPFTDG